MSEVGVVRTYDEFIARVRRTPFLRIRDFRSGDVCCYRALDGLFYVVGEEERRSGATQPLA
jgi:hypothetical protein